MSIQDITWAIERMEEGIRQVRNDATPAQVGLTADELDRVLDFLVDGVNTITEQSQTIKRLRENMLQPGMEGYRT